MNKNLHVLQSNSRSRMAQNPALVLFLQCVFPHWHTCYGFETVLNFKLSQDGSTPTLPGLKYPIFHSYFFTPYRIHICMQSWQWYFSSQVLHIPYICHRRFACFCALMLLLTETGVGGGLLQKKRLEWDRTRKWLSVSLKNQIKKGKSGVLLFTSFGSESPLGCTQHLWTIQSSRCWRLGLWTIKVMSVMARRQYNKESLN